VIPRGGCGATAEAGASRAQARGKFLYAGDEKLYVRGVTYGTFRPNDDGAEYPDPDTVGRDFAEMAANGINVVRTYTAPPGWLLNLAAAHGLRLIVGIPWEQHVTFLDESARARSIVQRVRRGVRDCAGHPAVLCYAIGSEIPASIVRWHGRRRVERFLRQLYDAAKAEDPACLVTYVNYPSTEYLRLPFLDLVCFNIFLEDEERLEAYLARLQNIAGDRPLLITELGLDAGRHGEEAQAVSLSWQVRTAFRNGCAGAAVFSWTDEWHADGRDVDDWHFGLTDRHRQPRPALAAVREAFEDIPYPQRTDWPSASVIVCTHNGERTLPDCLDGIAELEYPDFETIVVDDGSTDAMAAAAIAERDGIRLIRTENRGLSAARNLGLEEARGEIVAYIDDDARPDPHWLLYVAAGFAGTTHAGIGGPNIAPSGQGLVAQCVDSVPGGPIHVLLSDREAEHIPGCNMAFRRAALKAIGGFDTQFRVAGDDVDICWRLRDAGWTIGFSPGAMVWHRRRGTIRAFLRQQRQYGKAEALLERKWPERYNRAGHVRWVGRVYGGALGRIGRRARIYYGTWGTGLFQPDDPLRPGVLAALPVLPEWYLVILGLVACAGLGIFWSPLLVALPLLVLAVGALLFHAWAAVARALNRDAPRRARMRGHALTAVLYLLQPLARLSGRLHYGLTPWRLRTGVRRAAIPWPRARAVWSEHWQTPEAWVSGLESWFKVQSSDVRRGGEYARWDLQVRGGSLGAARLRTAVEEHGEGRQFARYRIWPRLSRGGLALIALLAALAVVGVLDGAWQVAAVLGVAAAVIAVRMVQECAFATDACLSAVAWQAGEPEDMHTALRGQVRRAKTAGAFAVEARERGEA
jgi:O-antigen biosynthesis protein